MQVIHSGPLARLVRRWHQDRSGATLVQFVAVLPAFVLLVYGTYVGWQVMSARERLCNAAWQASRYLQVEGPRFPEGTVFPDDWAKVSLDFLKEEAVGSPLLEAQILDINNVKVWSNNNQPTGPKAPASGEDSTVQAVDDAQFAVSFTVDIPHPLLRMWNNPDATDAEKLARSRLKLSCQRLAYAEDPPVGATAKARGRSCPPCRDQRCTPGPAGPTPTPCNPGDNSDACRCTCPCRR
ncbi:MAG: TadE/TadG family type IV pilus assembly protein [Ardenticatenales bacterium]